MLTPPDGLTCDICGVPITSENEGQTTAHTVLCQEHCIKFGTVHDRGSFTPEQMGVRSIDHAEEADEHANDPTPLEADYWRDRGDGPVG